MNHIKISQSAIMSALCQERFSKCTSNMFLNSQKQVVSEVTLRKENQLLFKCTVTDKKRFYILYYFRKK